MKKIIFIWNTLIVFIVFISSSGCKKLVEIPGNSPTQITTDQVFADSLSATNGVVGIYIKNFNNLSPFAGLVTIYTSMSADELTTSEPFYRQFYENNLTAGSGTNLGGSVNNLWSGFYDKTMIYQANSAIEGLTASNGISSNLKNQLIGECKVIRAVAYFNLVNLFGEVPLAVTSDYRINNKLPGSSVDSTYASIIRDLKDAIVRLKVSYPSANRARPNLYTAQALLSRVYLYRKQYKSAEDAATSVIGAGIYNLENNIDNTFLNGSSEAIWQAAPLGFSPYLTPEAAELIPYANDIIPVYYATAFLLNAFEPGDKRKSHWLASNVIDGVSYYYPYKYKNSYSGRVGSTVESYMIIRLSELYLIRAEARLNQSNVAGAIDDLNLLRTRAREAATPTIPNPLPPLSNSMPLSDAVKAVAHERQIELFCEWGHRWYDLKRTGTINDVLGTEKKGIWPVDGHAALYPIPYSEIQANPFLKQNRGY